jgi:hypothetical protein
MIEIKKWHLVRTTLRCLPRDQSVTRRANTRFEGRHRDRGGPDHLGYLEEVYPTPPLLGSTPKDKALVTIYHRA